MTFAYPQYLWLLLGLPVMALLLWWANRRRLAVLRRFASQQVLAYLAPHYSHARRLLQSLLFLAAVTFAIFAAARPQWGYEERKIRSRGLDIIVAVDVSTSMLARASADGTTGSRTMRLDRAKDLLQNILWRARGDRVGIMAFAGSSIITCPLTLDYGMAKTALQQVGPDSVSSQGTAIATAIDAAVKAFEMSSTGERILVLLTDGEDTGSDVKAAAERARKAGIKIYAIGIGSTQAVPIMMPDGRYKADHEGKTVYSKLDFDTLAEIASLTGGKAIKANPSGIAELDVVLGDIEQMQKTDQQDSVRHIPIERFQWFLVPAILLLMWEALETGYTRKARAWKGR